MRVLRNSPPSNNPSSLVEQTRKAQTEKSANSGSRFIGHIPSHWSIQRFKFLLQSPLQYGANEAADEDDYTQPRFIRITDISEDGSLRDDTFRSLPDEIAKPYLLKDGDVLLARSGATVGKSFFYRPSWGRAAYAGYLIRARLDPRKAIPQFIYFFAQSNAYWQWVQSIFIQATIQNISAEKYANLIVPVPPLDEQEAIAAFIDRETTKITELIAGCSALGSATGVMAKMTGLLSEYRAALISNAVTGQIDVRNYRPEVPCQ